MAHAKTVANLQVQPLPLDQALIYLKKVQPKLAKILEDWSPGKDYHLYKIQYPYGVPITRKGLFGLPTQNKSVLTLDDPHIPSEDEYFLNILSTDPYCYFV